MEVVLPAWRQAEPLAVNLPGLGRRKEPSEFEGPEGYEINGDLSSVADSAIERGWGRRGSTIRFTRRMSLLTTKRGCHL